ncbi:hypothetical protein [Leptospira sarikeiensis]|uniref:Lipoprotein n=1 Tax=Leptospira sarikeiensis TaxID=2484943 RepID=A0A4R9KH59_9LEPT|nr:hypothetical protein [Leptospira sarikeiensis]TGL64888.1 hypothetical protein EHQ64_01070 [Leptospira sarikeiensis]
MNLKKFFIILFAILNFSGCIFAAGDGYVESVKNYSPLRELKTSKIYLHIEDEFTLLHSEEIKTRFGKVEKVTRFPIPEPYLLFRDAFYHELKGRYKLDVEVGMPEKKDANVISIRLFKPRFDASISKATFVLNKGTDLAFKLEIVNEWKVIFFILPVYYQRSKSPSELADLAAAQIYNSILAKSEE